MPENLIEHLRYSNKQFEKDRIVYIAKEYIAYVSLKVKKSNANGVDVEISNIRRKGYYNKSLNDKDIRDLNKISNGIKFIQEKSKYIKNHGGDIQDYSFTNKFI